MEVFAVTQVGVARGVGDVVTKIVELFRAADEMVETFRLPESTSAIEKSIDSLGCKRLPRETLPLNIGCTDQADDHMNMVRHYHEIAE